MSSEFDVIVLGAGPAGSAAAIECANSGLSVSLIDSGRSSRAMLGETLHPGVICLFDMLGISESIRGLTHERPSGFEVRRGCAKLFVPYGFDTSGQWRGYTLWQHTLESTLSERARSVGVTVWTNSPATDVAIAGRRVAGVTVSKCNIHAPFLIDATGARRWLSRRLGFAYHKYSPGLLAFYGSGPATDDHGENPHWDADTHGWSWIAPVEPAVSSWTCLDLNGREHKSIASGSQMPKFSVACSARDVTWRMASRCAGPGFFIVGDAAGLLDPGSSKGVLRALASGIKASWFVSQILNGKKGELEAYQEYSEWFRRFFTLEATELVRRYGLIFPDVPWIAASSARLEREPGTDLPHFSLH
jgi:flavin-dependent dehydrogenase